MAGRGCYSVEKYQLPWCSNTELKIYHLSFFHHTLIATSTLLILAVCRTRVKYEPTIHRIHKWRTRAKKLVPGHESEALEDKQTSQMKTFSELAECLARIPPKITLYGLLHKYNFVGCLLLLMFSIDLLFAIKRDAYIFKETG